MTAPRIISAYEAEGLLRHGTDAELAAAAPDLATSIVALHARAEQAEANYRWMVERAADQRLDGYRELGARCAALEAERDAAAVLVRDLAASVVALHARAELLDEAFTVITDGQVDADWEGWCARVVRVLETIKVTP